MKTISIIFILFSLITIVSASVEVGFNDNSQPKVVVQHPETPAFNNNTQNVNSSSFWGFYNFADYNMPLIKSFAYNMTYTGGTFNSSYVTNATINNSYGFSGNVNALSLSTPFRFALPFPNSVNFSGGTALVCDGIGHCDFNNGLNIRNSDLSLYGVSLNLLSGGNIQGSGGVMMTGSSIMGSILATSLSLSGTLSAGSLAGANLISYEYKPNDNEQGVNFITRKNNYGGYSFSGENYSSVFLSLPDLWISNKQDSQGILLNGSKSVFDGNVVIADTTSLGTDIVTNGAFTGSSAGWTLAGGITYNSNNLKAQTTNGTATQTITTTIGQVYLLSIDISSPIQDGKALTIQIGNDFKRTYTPYTQGISSTYKSVFTATTTSELINITSSQFSINKLLDNVKVQPITSGNLSVAGQTYLNSALINNATITNLTAILFSANNLDITNSTITNLTSITLRNTNWMTSPNATITNLTATSILSTNTSSNYFNSNTYCNYTGGNCMIQSNVNSIPNSWAFINLSSSGQIFGGSGGSDNPTYSFLLRTKQGIYRVSNGDLGVSVAGGTSGLLFGSTGVTMTSGGILGWSNYAQANGTVDTKIIRSTAGVINATNSMNLLNFLSVPNATITNLTTTNYYFANSFTGNKTRITGNSTILQIEYCNDTFYSGILTGGTC